MAFNCRAAVFFSLFTILLGICLAEVSKDAVDVEDIQDPKLKERVTQALLTDRQDIEKAPSSEGETNEDAGRAPSALAINQDRFHSYPLCGVFILCERRGGHPDAQLFKGFHRNYFVRTTGHCRTAPVTGSCAGKTNVDHAKLWPAWFGGLYEEFYEMCFYREQKHLCRNGQVLVYQQLPWGSPTVVYKCDRYYEAHTVTFCMNKFPYFCKYKNPLLVNLPGTSPVIARA